MSIPGMLVPLVFAPPVLVPPGFVPLMPMGAFNRVSESSRKLPLSTMLSPFLSPAVMMVLPSTVAPMVTCAAQRSLSSRATNTVCIVPLSSTASAGTARCRP